MQRNDGIQEQNAFAHLKFGLVTEHDPVTGYAKVKFDENDDDEDGEFVSDWLPVVVPFSLADKITWPIDVNTQVACIMDCNLEQGWICGCLYNDEDAPDGGTHDLFRILFKGGSFEQFNRASGDKSVSYKGDFVSDFKTSKMTSALGAAHEITATHKISNSTTDLKSILVDLLQVLQLMTFTNGGGVTLVANNVASLTPILSKINALLT